MKIITLMENTACREDLTASHGLSLYIETPKHNILFDMGPDNEYIHNAEKLGVDLKAVDIAVLSHGHYDHGGGLAMFRLLNDHAKIYLHRAAFKEYYMVEPGEESEYIGLDQSMSQKGFTFVGPELVIDDELTLFAEVKDNVGALRASSKLYTSTFDGFLPDTFAHEQNLLITAEGKTVLIAGCAHCGKAAGGPSAGYDLRRVPSVPADGGRPRLREPDRPDRQGAAEGRHGVLHRPLYRRLCL